MMNGNERTQMTLQCRDCDALPKSKDAGQLIGLGAHAVQIMHNGLKVVAGGYHGDWMSAVIHGLSGHHEPQEEFLFSQVLKHARKDSLIAELGSFWAYYTLWYLHDVSGSRAVCIEPDPQNMRVGKRNAEINKLQHRIDFHEAWIGGRRSASVTHVCESSRQPRTLPCLDMAALSEICERETIELLHVDAQGIELEFIQSIPLQPRQLRFLMVSTHHESISGSPHTHFECRHAIENSGGHILSDFDVHESFSGDGLILASFFTDDQGLSIPSISRNARANSLFG